MQQGEVRRVVRVKIGIDKIRMVKKLQMGKNIIYF